ncbi:MAG: Hvo_1808 family surface protein [Haloarculaceae archaeon]
MRSALSLALVALVAVSVVPTAAGAAAGTATDRSPTTGAPTAVNGADETPSILSTNDSDAASDHDACAEFAEDPRPNPDSDQLGYENGCWANETLSVDNSDGFTEAELDAVLARSMARVETIRELEFTADLNLSFVTAEEYTEIVREFQSRSGEPTTEQRLHQNVKFEALFFVNESADYFDVQERNSQTNVPRAFTVTGESQTFRERGIYKGDVAIITRDGEIPQIGESTLGHELVHVLQVQRNLNITTPASRNTEDSATAFGGVVEGDATYVGTLYSERCGAEWDCLSEPDTPPPNVANLALVLYGQTNYAEGPGLFEYVHENQGWEGVNDIYENPPKTTEQLIHPETYPDETGRDLEIEDASSDPWRPLDIEGPTDHATFGEAGIFMMLYYPSYETRSNVVIPVNHPFENTGPGFYNYDHPNSAGWDGDRLLPYVTDESAETGETGYVWKTAWDSADDAKAFRFAYLQLLRHYGAEEVPGRANTFRLPDESGFGDAFWVEREGDVVTIVNGPTVETLSGIRDGAAPDATPTPTATDAPTETATATATDAPTTETAAPTDATAPTATATTTDATEGSGPGFGVLAVLAALAIVAARRRNDR